MLKFQYECNQTTCFLDDPYRKKRDYDNLFVNDSNKLKSLFYSYFTSIFSTTKKKGFSYNST